MFQIIINGWFLYFESSIYLNLIIIKYSFKYLLVSLFLLLFENILIFFICRYEVSFLVLFTSNLDAFEINFNKKYFVFNSVQILSFFQTESSYRKYRSFSKGFFTGKNSILHVYYTYI